MPHSTLWLEAKCGHCRSSFSVIGPAKHFFKRKRATQKTTSQVCVHFFFKKENSGELFFVLQFKLPQPPLVGLGFSLFQCGDSIG